jgi:N-acetylmuramoyl-L-alanine amidase
MEEAMTDSVPRRVPRPSRRAFLRGAGRVGAAGLALAALGSRAAEAAPSRATRSVLVDRVLHRGAADFAGGRRGGLALLARRDGGGLRSMVHAAVYESAPLPLRFAATHLGLRWLADGRGSTALAFAVRTSPNGRDWSEWLQVPAAGLRPSAEGTEGHSVLARVPRGDFAQYRVEFPAEPGARLLQLGLSYLNPYDGPEHALHVAALDRPSPFPFPFRPREEWGADESLRFTPSGAESWPRMYVPVKKLVVHHTATTNDYLDAAAEVRAIYVFHTVELDWGDIGYNALIGRDGVVYEGRRGRGPAREADGRQLLSPGVVAGHAFFHNYGSTGYALIGDFSDMPLPPLLRQRLVDLLVYTARRDGVDPATLGDFLRSDGIWHRDLPNVSGHRDLVVTECPGDQVYRILPDVRAAVAERLGGDRASATARVFVTGGLPGDTTLRALGALAGGVGLPAPGWGFSSYLEYWRRDGPYDIVPPDNGPRWGTYSLTGARALVDLEPGHYTLHLRGRDPLGQQAAYESNVTFHVTDELMADDEDLAQTERVGRWQRRTDGKGINGESWEEAPAGQGECVFRWRPFVSETGVYEVWVRWPEISGLAGDAPYAVRHEEGAHRERLDQRAGGGEWTRLGGEQLFSFRGGRAAEISLANDASRPVAADAVKLVLRARR